MKPKPGASCVGSKGTSFTMVSYIIIAPLASFSGAPPGEGEALLLDVHVGVYAHHASSRSMVGKAFQQGFYWPTTVSDATQNVRPCRGCQYFAR
jgi:hypothetical protein